MPDISVLAGLTDEDPRDFAALELSCMRFIDAWLDAGGESGDAAIAGFYSLWAQGLDDRGTDEAGFFGWARPRFIQYREQVRELLQAAPPRC